MWEVQESRSSAKEQASYRIVGAVGKANFGGEQLSALSP